MRYFARLTLIRNSVARWFLPPVFVDRAATERALIFSRVAWTSVLAVAIVMVSSMVAQPGIAREAAAVLVIFTAVNALLLELNKRGWTEQASWLFIGFCVLLVTQRSFAAGGIRSPGVGMYFVFALTAGLLLGERAGVLVAIFCSAVGFGLVVAEHAGLIRAGTFRYSATEYWLLNCLYMAIVITLLRLATQSLKRSSERTARELAERQKTEHRLSVALQAGEIGTWDVELIAGDFHADARCFEIFGLCPATSGLIPRTTWMETIHPDDQPVMRSAVGDLLGGSPRAKVRFRVIRPGGIIRHVEITAVPIDRSEGQRSTHVGTIIDITEQNEAAEERKLLTRSLRERVKELRALHLAAALLRDKPIDRSLLADFATLISQAWSTHQFCEVHIRYCDMEVATNGWKNTPSHQTVDFTTTVGQGAITVAYTGKNAIVANGPFCTETKNLLSSFAELLVGHLERDHAEQRRQNAEMQLRQAQKMDALGTLAGGIAHDFNNVLATIQGFSGLLEDDLPASSQQRRFAERISRACEHGKDVVGQILAFARHGTQERQTTRLSALLHECAELLSGMLPESIKLNLCLAQPDVTVSANRGQIRQVILNLCGNAWESIGERQGVIHIDAGRLANTELDRLARLQPSADSHFNGKLDLTLEYACIRVTDTGPGIAPDVLKRIFDPFFTTKGRRRGTGLGLAVVHGVVESHGGFIVVETTYGQGTRFSVLLPANQEKATVPGVENPDQVIIGRERLLIVDDKFDVADSLAIAFERLGYDVLALTDPHDALQALSEAPDSWHVLITDHVMPQMNGTHLITLAKRLVPTIVAILCTGCTSDEAQHCSEVDLQFYKPISAADIARAMRKVLDERGSPVQEHGRAVV